MKQEGDDFFLLDTESGEVFQVNSTAAQIFSLCQRGATYETAVEALANTFNSHGQEDVILQDIRATIQQLQELGLCETPAAAAAARR